MADLLPRVSSVFEYAGICGDSQVWAAAITRTKAIRMAKSGI